MRKLLVVLVCLPIFGCAGIGSSTSTDLVACGVALGVSGIFDPGGLAIVAFQTPACQALAKDVLDALIAKTVTTNVEAARRNAAARARH